MATCSTSSSSTHAEGLVLRGGMRRAEPSDAPERRGVSRPAIPGRHGKRDRLTPDGVSRMKFTPRVVAFYSERQLPCRLTKVAAAEFRHAPTSLGVHPVGRARLAWERRRRPTASPQYDLERLNTLNTGLPSRPAGSTRSSSSCCASSSADLASTASCAGRSDSASSNS